jgi:hypothetical protein
MSEDRFICEIPLKNPTKKVESVLFARLDFARIAYNHCVTELNRRYGLMNESVAARQLRAESKRFKTGKSASLNPHIVDCEDAKQRSFLWRALYKQYQIDGEYCLATFVSNFRHENSARVRGNAVPVTVLHESAGSRAWRAFEPFLYRKPAGNGFRGQPRRRPRTIPFTTITTRSTEKNHGAIRFNGDHVTWSNGLNGTHKSVISLKTMIDNKDVVIKHALDIVNNPKKDEDGNFVDPICQLRVGYREVKKARRWFVQLVLAGRPLVKRPVKVADGTVGVTIGVRHLAVVAPRFHLAELLILDDYITDRMVQNQRLEVIRARAQDRSRRAMNPEAFDEKGMYIKGKRARNRSNRYRNLSLDRREYNRKVNERKKTHRNTFAQMIVRLGKSVHIPDLPYAKWQKRRGSAMLISTPAAFAESIIRIAKKRGVEVVMIDSKKAKNAQRCHLCKRITKRPLNRPVVDRMANCACGRPALQQHVYASFLASQSGEDGKLVGRTIEKDWEAIRDKQAKEMNLERVAGFFGDVPSKDTARETKKPKDTVRATPRDVPEDQTKERWKKIYFGRSSKD